jgi:hypothetical protein
MSLQTTPVDNMSLDSPLLLLLLQAADGKTVEEPGRMLKPANLPPRCIPRFATLFGRGSGNEFLAELLAVTAKF